MAFCVSPSIHAPAFMHQHLYSNGRFIRGQALIFQHFLRHSKSSMEGGLSFGRWRGFNELMEVLLHRYIDGG